MITIVLYLAHNKKGCGHKSILASISINFQQKLVMPILWFNASVLTNRAPKLQIPAI